VLIFVRRIVVVFQHLKSRMSQATSLIHRLPDDLLGMLWSCLDSASRKAFFHTCHFVHSAPSIHCQLGTKLRVQLGEDENPWQIRGGFGGQTLRRKPPLLRQPGSHLHTLVVRGSGAYIDGPRLQHLLTLSSYAEGEDRSRAARLLGGLKVLEVEVCNLDAAFATLPCTLHASCPNLTTLRVLELPDLSRAEILMGTELLEVERDLKERWMEELAAKGETVSADEADERFHREIWNLWQGDNAYCNLLDRFEELEWSRKGRMLRNTFCCLGIKGVKEVGCLLGIQRLREIEYTDASLLCRCFSPNPSPGLAPPLLPSVVLLHVGASTVEQIVCLLPKAFHDLPVLEAVVIETLSEYHNIQWEEDEEDMIHDDMQDMEDALVSLAALLHSATLKGVRVEARELSLRYFWIDERIPRLLEILEHLRGTYLLDNVCKLTFEDTFGGGQMRVFSSLMPNLQELQFSDAGGSITHTLIENVARVPYEANFKKLRSIQICLETEFFGMKCPLGGERGILQAVGNFDLVLARGAGHMLLREFAVAASANAHPIDITFQATTDWHCTGLSSLCAQQLTNLVMKDWLERGESLCSSRAGVRLHLCVRNDYGKTFFSA